MHLHEVIFQLPEVLKQGEQCVKYLSLPELGLFEICSTTINLIAMTSSAPRQSFCHLRQRVSSEHTESRRHSNGKQPR